MRASFCFARAFERSARSGSSSIRTCSSALAPRSAKMSAAASRVDKWCSRIAASASGCLPRGKIRSSRAKVGLTRPSLRSSLTSSQSRDTSATRRDTQLSLLPTIPAISTCVRRSSSRIAVTTKDSSHALTGRALQLRSSTAALAAHTSRCSTRAQSGGSSAMRRAACQRVKPSMISYPSSEAGHTTIGDICPWRRSDASIAVIAWGLTRRSALCRSRISEGGTWIHSPGAPRASASTVMVCSRRRGRRTGCRDAGAAPATLRSCRA
jgi:hypothetical protein